MVRREVHGQGNTSAFFVQEQAESDESRKEVRGSMKIN